MDNCRHNRPMGDCACSHDLLFTVRVDFSTHDALQQGVTALGFCTVQVLAPTDTQATLTACHMVLGRHNVMPTRTTVMDCVA